MYSFAYLFIIILCKNKNAGDARAGTAGGGYRGHEVEVLLLVRAGLARNNYIDIYVYIYIYIIPVYTYRFVRVILAQGPC